jgi:hypothetical protein
MDEKKKTNNVQPPILWGAGILIQVQFFIYPHIAHMIAAF